MQTAFIGVEAIYSTALAFAAVLNNGSVVLLCEQHEWFASSTVQATLIGVETSYSTADTVEMFGGRQLGMSASTV